ncbi:VCBS domain-containing protein [Candidimonas nitroreducens]|nr:VCBS domain-containing protein [Candidimonas nitroreducens]
MVDVPGNRAATTPDGVTTDQVVFESGLAEGSATNEADTQVNASFTVKALDGLSESGAITLSYQDVDGVTQTKVLSRAEIEALGGTAQHIETQYGTLELNGYHQAADGTLTIDYSYVLTKAPEVAGTDVLDKIGVTAADRNGDVDDTSSIAIKIVDDAPQAHADASSITEDATEATVSGNVLGEAGDTAPGLDDVADTQGADGATVTGIISNNVPGNTADDSVSGELTIKGAYGAVVIHADGSYDYTLDNTNHDVDALNANDTLEDTFSYTITDSDGDPSTATLTVTINGSNDDPVITESNQSGAVIEAGNLDDGTVVPGDPTVSGSFTASDVDNDTFTWSVIDPDTTYGTFSVDSATGVWTYELDNTLAATQALNEGDTVELTYIVQVNDGSGGTDTRNVTITITGTNDSPVANADTGTVKEAGVDNGDNTPTEGIPTATGNVLTNDTDVDDGEKKTLTVSEVSFDGAVGELGTALGGVYGSLVLKEDGTYTYTLANDDLDTQALHQGETVTEVFSYTTVDAMGATSTSTLTITVTGTNDQPGITSVEADAAGQVTEKGTGVPGDDTATGTLAAHDVDTGATLTWSIAGTGTNGTYGTISIDPTTGKWTYTLDDDRAATQGLNHGDTGTETFTARVTDEHGAYDEQVITVTVNGSDDNLTGAGDETVHLTEDGSATGTLQDYVSDVDDVLKVTTFKVDNDGDGNDETYTLGDNYTSGDDIILKDAVGNVLGTLTIAENGAYTFTPAENYAGEVPTVTYTMAESSGGTGTVTQTLTFEIAKVADTPALEDDKTVHTNEDTSVSLDLVAPGITDTGTGDGAITHDYSERLGEITLTLSGAGATGVTLVTGTMELAPVDGKITIVLTDVDHVSSLPAEDNAHGVYYLTKAEYEALEANPPAESGRNFTVTVSATSYEVDSTGAILPGVDGATSTQTIDVDVQAVTDGAKLSIDGADSASLSVDEDNTIDLTSHLTFHLNDTDGNAALDTDGSEEYQYSISGLPVGAVVTIGGVETVISALDQKVSSAWTDSAEPPTIKVKPPANFSGDIDGITITLESKDTDIDSIGDISTVSSSVVLGLHVDPMAGDVSAAGVTTPEDTAVHFLQNVAVTDTGSGSEVIDSVTFTVPTGWEVTPPSSSAEWSYDLTGSTATITFDGTLTEAEREAVLDGFTITPPAHSSKDETITLSIETTDSNTVNGSTVTDTQTVDRDVKITVTPVAETTNQDGNASGSLVDTDHDGFADLTMTQGHPYATPGEEDKWFDLSQDGAFDLAEGWVDQDSGEKLFARLTPELVAGDGGPSGAIGSQFKWIEGGVDHIVTYVGSPIDVPVDALGTLQFKAAPDFSGKFDIKVEAHTVDMDDDGNGVSSEATSGESHLVNILIKPVADDVTLTLSGHASGKEDTNIPLAINPTSSDPSETFVVTISGIPDGAIIYYGGVAQTAIDGSVKITDFNTATDLYISPPANSNKDFTLQVHADSVDTLIIDGDGGSPYSSINTTGPTLNIVVAMHGVADTAVVQPKIVANFTEADLDDGTKSVKLSDLVSVSTPDEDGSETLTVRVSGLPDGFALDSGLLVTDHSITGEARVWVLTEDQLADATITVPENYSGEVHFKVAGVTTEDDGDTHTGTAVPVTFTVTPSPEAVMSTSATISEDARSNVGLHIVHQHGDTDETLAGVRIDASQFTDKNFTLYVDGAPITDLTVTDGYYILSPEQAATLSAQGSENLDGDLGSFAFEYQITDAASDGSGTTTSPWTPATFEIHATAVTDQPNASITAIAGTLDTTVSDDASPDTVSVEVADIVTVNFHVDSPDTDGSEHLVRVVIDGVPDGVTVGVSDGEGGVVDGRYLGGGRWLLVYDGEDAKAIGSEGLDLSVRFDVSGQADKGVHDITMTAQVQDNGNDQANAGLVETDSVTWHLETTDVTDGPAGPAESPAPITEWAYNDTSATEDSPFTLDEKIDAGVMLPGIGTHAFTVTLTDLPGGSSVAGMVHTVIDGHDVWTATKLITVDGSTTQNDIDDALQELLHSISVTPPPNSNENNATGGFTFDADLTTSLVGGAGSDAVNTRSVTPTIPVEPVTDEATIAIAGTDSELNESDTSIPFDITVSNLADGSHGIIVDGKLYLQVGSTTSALDGGTLSLIGAGDHTLTTETDPAGLPSGTYYVIDKVDMGETLHFDYQPDTMTKGDVTVKTWVTNQEENANPVQVDNSATLTVAISNDGAQITSNAVTGGEAAVAGKESLIQLTGLQATLIDGDGSEKFHSILLSDVPSGFLVYIGNSASDAHMASNAGGQDGMNTWVISEESLTMPAYIAILPPAHWSGTLSGLELIVKSGEDSLTTTVTDTHVLEPITIDPIANGITLDPTHAFGTEGHIIPINLNAAMADATDASITVGTSTIEDTSQETTTLKLTGLGEHASFYIGGVLIDGVAYDSANGGTYTITGLTQDALHKLGFIQASSDLHDQDTTTPGMQIGVEAWTVESGNGDESVHDSNTITLNVSNQLATNGDNSLIWTGNSIDGLSGTDTVHFRQGETLSGTDLAAKLSNIETLDLSISGDNKINDLTPEQVRTILGSGGDSSGTLTVHGDGAGDKVALSGTWTNNHDGTWTGTLDDGVSTVKLIVDGGASVDETAVTPESQGLSFSPMSLMLDLPDTQSDGSTSESSFLFDQESTLPTLDSLLAAAPDASSGGAAGSTHSWLPGQETDSGTLPQPDSASGSGAAAYTAFVPDVQQPDDELHHSLAHAHAVA